MAKLKPSLYALTYAATAVLQEPGMATAVLAAAVRSTSDPATVTACAEVLQVLAVHESGALALVDPQVVQLLTKALADAESEQGMLALSASLKVHSAQLYYTGRGSCFPAHGISQ
jgi:uncharacterized membrane protein